MGKHHTRQDTHDKSGNKQYRNVNNKKLVYQKSGRNKLTDIMTDSSHNTQSAVTEFFLAEAVPYSHDRYREETSAETKHCAHRTSCKKNKEAFKQRK